MMTDICNIDTFAYAFLEISSFTLDYAQCCIQCLKLSSDLIYCHHWLRHVLQSHVH